MKGKSEAANNRKVQKSTMTVRATISFPADLYETLETLAIKKKVSLAWVVRDAAERYAADQRSVSCKGMKE